MKRLLIFSGTTEGRLLAEHVQGKFQVTVSVATEYGRELARGLHVITGRMDSSQMEDYFRKKRVELVVDATHPYAREATKNIKAAAEKAGIAYIRIVRKSASGQGLTVVKDACEAATVVQQREGNILLTTGSKDLDVFTTVRDYRKRIYPRVLPVVGSIGRCYGLGYEPSHVIAMQGPFSEKLNIALMDQFHIKLLVTKDSGPEGGIQEKLAAARAVGAEVILIQRPDQEGGLTLEEAIEYLEGVK